MSRRVIDDKVITGHVTEEDLKELYDFNPVSQEDPASLSRPEVPLIANLPFAIANRIGTVLKHEDFFLCPRSRCLGSLLKYAMLIGRDTKVCAPSWQLLFIPFKFV